MARWTRSAKKSSIADAGAGKSPRGLTVSRAKPGPSRLASDRTRSGDSPSLVELLMDGPLPVTSRELSALERLLDDVMSDLLGSGVRTE